MDCEKYHIGIDLGTTNCTCSVLTPNQGIIKVTFDNNTPLLRSALCYTKTGEKIVGLAAMKRLSEIASHNLITNSKLLFGCDFNSPYTQEVAPSCKADVVNKDGKAGFFIPSLGRVVLPEEVSEELLRVIYQKAVKRIGDKPIGSVTITVPVKYSLLQRKLLRNAAVNVGITCPIHIITEPTAAAIAYGVENTYRNGNILIYDLGGGTFDVSIVQIHDGSYFEFINKDGNRSIGGSLFDRLIQNYLEECFQKDHFGGQEIPLVPSFLTSAYTSKYLRTLNELHNTC